MYNTPLGNRIVQGAERALLSDALGMMADNLRIMKHPSEIEIFDNLTHHQQIGILHVAARALLCGDQPPPALTAVLEGAVAAIYDQVRTMLEVELYGLKDPPLPDRDWGVKAFRDSMDYGLPTWRERVLAACRELEVGGDLPNPDSPDEDDWDLPLDALENCVLWDTDWGLRALLDASPEASRQAKTELGIEDEYFVAVAPDPTDEEARRLLAELIRLTPESRGLDPDDKEMDFGGPRLDFDDNLLDFD